MSHAAAHGVRDMPHHSCHVMHLHAVIPRNAKRKTLRARYVFNQRCCFLCRDMCVCSKPDVCIAVNVSRSLVMCASLACPVTRPPVSSPPPATMTVSTTTTMMTHITNRNNNIHRWHHQRNMRYARCNHARQHNRRGSPSSVHPSRWQHYIPQQRSKRE